MSQHTRPRLLRGIAAVRADAADPKAAVEELNKAFEAFKAEHNKEQADIKKRLGDVVQTEKVGRINVAIGDLQKFVDGVNAKVAALQVGAGAANPADPAKAEHAKAFDRFFRSGVDAGLRELEIKAALRSNSDPDGGYVVPQEMQKAIDELLRTVSTVRGLANVITIGTSTYKKMINMQGATAGWVGETDTRAATTTPQLSALEFPVMELYANPATTQTLLDDASISIETWLANEVEGEFADQEGDAFVNGTGIAKPKGLIGAAYTKVANASYAWGSIGYIASGAAADFAASNPGDKLIDLIHALKPGYRQAARWLMNDLTTARIRKFKDGQGQYLWQPSMQVGTPASLLGYPVANDDNMPDVNTNTYSIAFADFNRAYLIIDRIGIRVLRNPYTSPPYVYFYTTKRVGGGIQNFEAIKLMKIATS